MHRPTRDRDVVRIEHELMNLGMSRAWRPITAMRVVSALYPAKAA
jgi:hypothetical protein